MRTRFTGINADLRMARFLLVGATGLVVNNLALIFFTEFTGTPLLVSVALATVCSTLWNFGLTELWVFGDRKQSSTRMSRLLRFVLVNGISLGLRAPIISVLVTVLGIHYVAANLASLLTIALIRYALSDRWIWTAPQTQEAKHAFHYDIHGILAVRSRIQLPELEHFRVPQLDRAPDLRVQLERRSRVRFDVRTIHYHDGLGKYGFQISIAVGDPTEVQVSRLIARSPHVLYTNVVEPILRWAFARKGFALVHGGCISQDGAAMLLTAKTDTGKTTTILRTVGDHRFKFLSDDMTLVARDGRVLSFPKLLTISAHTLGVIRFNSLTLREWLALQVQGRVHSRSGRLFAMWLSKLGLPAATINTLAQILVPPPKFPVERLIPEVGIRPSSSLSQVVLIERGNDSAERLDHEAIVNHLIQNGEDAYGFPPYPELAGYLSQWRGRDLHLLEREIISQAVRGKSAVHLRNPSYGWWKKLPAIQHLGGVRNKPPEPARIPVYFPDTEPYKRST